MERSSLLYHIFLDMDLLYRVDQNYGRVLFLSATFVFLSVAIYFIYRVVLTEVLNGERRERLRRKRSFLSREPDYGYRHSEKGFIDKWIRQEIPSSSKEIYLDYAGAALPWKSQLLQVAGECSTPLGNPHSSGPSASRTKRRIEHVKKRIMEHFGAENNYEIIFTSGATEGMRIVSERWKWDCLIYSQESHTSVVGMREGNVAKFICRPLDELLIELNEKRIQDSQRTLLVLSMESNFDGRRLDIGRVDTGGKRVFLDIAKSASTGPVCLSDWNPHFAALSFYKLFGAPTGLGCLFVRKDVISEFNHAAYFGGGAVGMVLPSEPLHVKREEPSRLSSLNNGTQHFRGIVELRYGFETLRQLGGMLSIRQHAESLAKEFVRRLKQLRHHDDSPVVTLYGPWAAKKVCSSGTIVTLNILRKDGSFVGYNEVSKLAALQHPPIQFRVGCFCNPGACQIALGISSNTVKENYEKTGHVCGDQIDIIDGQPTGAIRVSFGKESTWEDLDGMVEFIRRTFVTNTELQMIPKGAVSMPQHIYVSEMYIFPIKSCAAQRVKRWRFETQTGRPVFDREFALVDSDGRAMRLKDYPRMAFIRPEIDWEQGILVVEAATMPRLEISLQNTPVRSLDNSIVRVCGNRCGGVLWGSQDVSDWFSKYLDVRCWLARHSSSGYSVSSEAQLAGVDRRPGVAFANEKPILLISQEAVDQLNRVIRKKGQCLVSTKHFRPNLVVKVLGNGWTSDDHSVEDHWGALKHEGGELLFEAAGDCARCSMVDIDPSSGMKGDTLRALAEYRRKSGKIVFGIFLVGKASTELSDFAIVEEGDTFLCK